jgi:hypothetical protein
MTNCLLEWYLKLRQRKELQAGEGKRTKDVIDYFAHVSGIIFVRFAILRSRNQKKAVLPLSVSNNRL